MASEGHHIIVQKANAELGKGKALFEINKMKQFVDFTYRENDKFLTLSFELSLSHYGIAGINYNGLGVQDKVAVEVQLAKPE